MSRLTDGSTEGFTALRNPCTQERNEFKKSRAGSRAKKAVEGPALLAEGHGIGEAARRLGDHKSKGSPEDIAIENCSASGADSFMDLQSAA
jgi:hypothetical protein